MIENKYSQTLIADVILHLLISLVEVDEAFHQYAIFGLCGGAALSTVAAQQEGPGFEPRVFV